ncbi:MAG: hypothetical protein ACODAU_11955 [Myxococcota bacterium]
MHYRAVSLVGALVAALAMITSSAAAQDPAPWEAGEPPPEEEPAPEAEGEPAAPPPEQAAEAETDTLADDGEAAGELPPVGKIGIGYFTTSAPLGVRMWVSDRIGFDAGLGFSIDSTPADVGWGLSAEAGLLYALVANENMIVFGRGGLGFGFGDSGDPAADLDYEIQVNGMLGAEFFMTALGFPNLSFTAGIGLGMTFLEDEAGDFGIRVQTVSQPVNLVASAVLGFHIYL